MEKRTKGEKNEKDKSSKSNRNGAQCFDDDDICFAGWSAGVQSCRTGRRKH